MNERNIVCSLVFASAIGVFVIIVRLVAALVTTRMIRHPLRIVKERMQQLVIY